MATTTRHRKSHYDPVLDYNRIGPMVRDPDNPSPRNRRRHRHILDMMLQAGEWEEVRKILGTYSYLREEYGPRLARAIEEERRLEEFLRRDTD